MARRRFLVDQIRDGIAELGGEDARHVARVLRAEAGQVYEISDGKAVYLAEVAGVEKDRVTMRLLESVATTVLPVQVTLLAALIKFDRFEWMVEKATELSVTAIVPVNAARSEKGLFEAARKRAERWRRIAHESSQQARRVAPPEIADAAALAAALARAADYRYFLDEEPGAEPLLAAIPPAIQRRDTDCVALLTGPEGGWTSDERGAARAAGWKPVSLGPLILRAETAAITAVGALVQAWLASRIE